MKLITSQITIQLEESNLIEIITEDDYPIVGLSVEGHSIRIVIYDPDYVKAEILT